MPYTPSTDEPLLTAEQFAEVEEDDRYVAELVAGRLVREPRPGFEHGRISLRVATALDRFVESRRRGRVVVETGFLLADVPATVRAPDVAFVAADRIPDRRITGFFPGAPDLAVEIVSPGNRGADMQARVREYFDAGARLVWVVYPDTRTVAVHGSAASARFVDRRGALDGGDPLPGLTIDVAAIFR